ncbi:cytochrome P450 89A2-like [Vitis riparia]|uniref:cytochrome P450 89A2-like n=1 Tax=Vitis riparia TaxID=96939 RepID=UPI00155A8167|nr:cytochrome P450 89A2-like [Vitis riparia]
MDLWLFFLTSFCIGASLHALLSFLQNQKLPPGPPSVPILGNILWLLKSSKNFSNVETLLRVLRSDYGSIITLHIGSRPSIFLTTHSAAHKALLQNGATFASRPQSIVATQVLTNNHRTVSSSAYGPLWRLLRQNLMSIVHPCKLKSYSHCSKWALSRLNDKIRDDFKSGNAVPVVDHIRYTMFCLLSYFCFGEEFDEKTVREIEKSQVPVLSNFIRFNVLNFMPRLAKIVFRKLWKELLEIRRNQEKTLIPIIRACRGREKKTMVSYLDTLLELHVQDVGRKLLEEELVSLCSEFLFIGTDTSTAAMQWVMANLVKHQDIQEKVVEEINRVVKPGEEIKQEDVSHMNYLKAVVLEALRRHPPGHFSIPRSVTEETIFDGYLIPRDALVNFTVADMGWDPSVWEDPMEFRPERFMVGEGGEVEFDVKGVREIKMMPFGAGRRVCPAISFALFHIQYFVANLIRDFKWVAEDGGGVDLSEKKDGFTIELKHPLRALVSPRTIS